MYKLNYKPETEVDLDMHQYFGINQQQIRKDAQLYVAMYRKMLSCEEHESKPMDQSSEKIVYFERHAPDMEHRYHIAKKVTISMNTYQ